MVERHDKGASLAILNLGAGGAAFIGPFIAGEEGEPEEATLATTA
jgi:hypothetical protein